MKRCGAWRDFDEMNFLETRKSREIPENLCNVHGGCHLAGAEIRTRAPVSSSLISREDKCLYD